MAKLTITQGENKGISLEIEEVVIMGRSPETNLVIKDLRASRKHARVVKMGDECHLEDMNSQNGTLLNGQRISGQVKLKNKDNIRIGNTWITFSVDEESLSAGGTFLNYTILNEIAKEESGNFYLAAQAALERNVIIWALPVQTITYQAEQARENFFKRISTVASLFHRNIMMLMDFAVTGQYYYCAFEEVDFGSNIRNYLKNNPLPSLAEAMDIAIQIAKGMTYAHKQNVLHLHLTSKNVLIQTGAYRRVVLTEFGVSRFLSEMTSSSGGGHTTTGILGISEYIAPEQISGAVPESAATDIYSYGCLLYHLFGGKPPFPTTDASRLVRFHAEEKPVSLREVRREVPEAIDRLVQSCMEKDPADRYPSFDAILQQLQTFQAEQDFAKIVHSPEGRNMLKKYLGEKTLLHWWLILPLVAAITGILVFFGLPLVLK